jgi:hypothetical protein
MAPAFQAGDRVRLAPGVRVGKCAAGETGTVVRVVLRPNSSEVAGYLVQLDRQAQGVPATFYPEELEPAP